VDFSIIYPPGDKTGYPGSTCRVYVGILNEGTGIDAYGIEATSTLGWTITPQPDMPSAAPGEIVYAYFDVELPLWPNEDTTVNISYTVHSNLDPDLQESGSLQVTVDAAAFYAMTLVDSSSDQSGDPGTTLRFYVSVRNDGNEYDEYEITSTSAAGWTTNDQPGTVLTNPDDLDSLYFEVVLPTSIGDNDVSDVITYKVSSLNEPGLFVEYSVTATALAQAQYAVYITDRPNQQSGDVGTTVRFTVGARNDGNTADDFYISVTADLLGWSVSPQPGTVPVNPGETVYPYFDVTIPSGANDADMELLTYTVTSNSDPNAFGSGEVTLLAIDDGTDVGDDDNASGLPKRVSLAQNYPNPFNPTTTISFDLPAKSRVRLDIVNILGRKVDELELGQLPGGNHQVEYDGSALASGVYFYHLSTDFGQQTKKMILLK
ncbi:MAG: T9SS type A sorting domain-containing protein, partial [candidate division Zixibacteria bacterium]|nr:T9SS type A sorting domain-containing protein [candidate division Zixibacteria bacterium]